MTQEPFVCACIQESSLDSQSFQDVLQGGWDREGSDIVGFDEYLCSQLVDSPSKSDASSSTSGSEAGDEINTQQFINGNNNNENEEDEAEEEDEEEEEEEMVITLSKVHNICSCICDHIVDWEFMYVS